MKQFKELNKAFNMKESVESLEKTVKSLEKQGKSQNAMVSKMEANPQKYSLDSIEYFRVEIQNLIAMTSSVLEVMTDMCKVGAPPRMFEVFATLSNTQSNHIMNLVKLDELQTNYQVTESTEEIKKISLEQKGEALKLKSKSSPHTLIQNTTNNLTVSSTELLEMVKKADGDADDEMEEIDTEFDLS